MKKILALLLASVMVLSLAACGGTSTDTTEDTSTEGTETTETTSVDADLSLIHISEPTRRS